MDIARDLDADYCDSRDSRATQTLAARRRTSPAPFLSLSSNTTTSPRRSANARRPPPTSPEIISSLIDQLSAISASAADHFDHAHVHARAHQRTHSHSYSHSYSHSRAPSLASLPATPAASYTHSLSRHASNASHGPYYSAVRPQHDLGPDDACEPPVVRTSKPPSGKSPLTAPPKRWDKPHSLSSYIGRSGSSASIRSFHSARSASSVGNASIDLPPAVASSTRSSVESKRSLKGHRSLLYMSSREQLRQREVDRKRLDDPGAPNSPGRNSVQLFAYEDTIKEEPLTREDNEPESSRFAQRYRDRIESPRRVRLNLVDGPLDDTPIERGLVPDRGSSLRHSSSPIKKKSHRSGKSSHKDRSGAEKSSKTEGAEKSVAMDKPEKSSKLETGQQASEASQENHAPQNQASVQDHKTQTAQLAPGPKLLGKMDSDAAMKERLLMELEQEENEVAQRIRELREQKMRRDKMAGKMPAHNDAAAVSNMPCVSTLMTPAPEPRPTSSPSLTTYEGTNKPAWLPGSVGTPEEDPIQFSNHNRPGPGPTPGHSRHRSLTWNEGDDFNLVPFNYALALRTLEESAPNSPIAARSDSGRTRSPPPSSGSIISNHSQSPRIPVRRSNSLSVVGRSVLTRPMSSARTLTVKKHRPSLSVTDMAADDRLLSVRSASEENSARHSVVSTASASNSFKNQQRRATKKKRWSHPDLPAKAEKAHNAKVDKAEAAAAVQRAQFPAVEERPVSQDSIGIEVDTYLNSPRLSQKIRHPQTGRVISFSEVGDPEGYAIFVCVGMGLTRFVMAFYDQLAVTLKLRLITPERPGVGSSEADPNGTPLSWADDVLVICQALKVTKFSLLAHSAGAIYALATSLRMPQHIRGRVHLLAPWIPPSQMAPIGISQNLPPTQQLPRSQRFLRALPASFLKVANSTFLSGTSASLQRTGPKSTPKKTRKASAPVVSRGTSPQRPYLKDNRRESMLSMDQILPNTSSLTLAVTNSRDPTYEQAKQEALSRAEQERQRAFDERLTFAIWDRATANANPATDLIVCLETKQTIGFRYEDINRPVVIHHGSKDSRVPVDNVRWLGKLMRKCEVRILEGEQHGLMASAQVMGNVLTEMASDWDNWTSVVQQRSISDLRSLTRRRV